ncbi:hypothetical protein VE06_15760, partial [Salmonella enterica subsp. enterica serovar Indiana]
YNLCNYRFDTLRINTGKMMTISKRIIISFILFMCFTNNTFGSGYVKINAELNDMASRGVGTVI